MVYLIFVVVCLAVVESFSDWIPRRKVRDPEDDIDKSEWKICDVCGRAHTSKYPTCFNCIAWAVDIFLDFQIVLAPKARNIDRICPVR